MPSWKKVLISGSDAALNTLNVSTALTASGLIYPTVDGTPGQAIVTDGTGSLSFTTIVSGTGATTKLNQSIAAMTWSFAHNLNEQYPVVTIYDSNDEVIIPEKIDAVDANNLAIYFSTARIGRAVAVVGGTTVSASLSQTASYVDFNNTVASASHAEYAESSSFATYFNISQALTASGLLYPTTDGTVGQVITTDGTGNLSFLNVDNTRISIKNVSGGEIPKGTPLFITGSGTSGNVAGVIPADAGNPSLMPAGVIAGETLADGAEGVGLINGYISGVNTALFTPGDEVFVAVGGGYTNVAPTGSALIQKLGNVEKSHPSNGSGVINGPGATRSVPNILPGYSWVGNSDYVATPVATSSFFVTSGSHALTASYVNPLVQNVDITGNLIVNGTVTAQEFHTELVSSSIIYQSGSTQFGDTLDDTHIFTGSVSISGSVAADSFTGIFTGALSGSEQIASDISGSFTSLSSSIASDIEDIIDGTTIVTSATSASYALTASYVNTLTQNVNITGSVLVSSGSTTVDINSALGGFIEIVDSSTNNIGIALTGQSYGVSGWTGPSLWINDPTDSYPAVIGFQNKSTWTDGRVTFLTPISASNGITGSLLGTASYADNANLLDGLNSSQFLRNDQSGTITGDLTVTGIVTAQEFHTELVSSAVIYESGSTKFGDTVEDTHQFTGSVSIDGTLDIKSANVSFQENTNVDSPSPVVVATVSSTTYTAAFFDYYIQSGSNLRAGTITAVHDGTNIEYMDNSTQDLGTTSGVTLSCDLNINDLRLLATTTTDDWTIKTLIRSL